MQWLSGKVFDSIRIEEIGSILILYLRVVEQTTLLPPQHFARGWTSA